MYMRAFILFICSFLVLVQSTLAADATSVATTVPVNDSFSAILIFVLSILILLLLSLVYFIYTVGVALGVMRGAGTNPNVKPLFDLTDAVPIEREHEILLDHNYDGIKELDNNLPTWWLYLFFITIVFAVVYFSYFQLSDYGDNQIEEYDKSIIAANEEMKLHASKVDENSAKALTDSVAIEAGKTIFMENCAACHGKAGEGKVGPNLTDDYWLHGGDIKSVFKTIKYGVPSKGMISWQSQISPLQIQEVASYILTLKGTNPPDPKAPQGELVK